MIKIGAPYLEKISDDGVDYVRMCSKVLIDDKEELIWYEVDDKFSEYLCYEKADAFVVGILPYAMAYGHNIIVEGCPISEKIYWNLKHTFLPALGKFSGYYKKIEIESDITNIVFDAHGVGTGFSSGVDSFDTLLKNLNKETSSFNITHLAFFNVGACGSFGGANAQERFRNRAASYQSFVDKLGFEFVKVNSNIAQILMMSFNFTHTYLSCSAALAIQKLFCKYYYSAGCTLKDFSFNPYASSYYDLLNMQCFSTESISFSSTGSVESRLEKLEYISQYEITYDMLNVCNSNDFNCRTCEKCIRTMLGLYSINKLDNYSSVFDVEYFKKHLSYNVAFIMAKSKDGTVEAMFAKEIIDKMKENKLKIPFSSYLRAIPMTIKCILLATARKSKTLKKWWHRKINKEYGVRYNDI